MTKNVAVGRLTLTLHLADAVQGADAVFITVHKLTRRGDDHADFVYVAAEEVDRAATDQWSLLRNRPCRSGLIDS